VTVIPDKSGALAGLSTSRRASARAASTPAQRRRARGRRAWGAVASEDAFVVQDGAAGVLTDFEVGEVPDVGADHELAARGGIKTRSSISTWYSSLHMSGYSLFIPATASGAELADDDRFTYFCQNPDSTRSERRAIASGTPQSNTKTGRKFTQIKSSRGRKLASWLTIDHRTRDRRRQAVRAPASRHCTSRTRLQHDTQGVFAALDRSSSHLARAAPEALRSRAGHRHLTTIWPPTYD